MVAAPDVPALGDPGLPPNPTGRTPMRMTPAELVGQTGPSKGFPATSAAQHVPFAACGRCSHPALQVCAGFGVASAGAHEVLETFVREEASPPIAVGASEIAWTAWVLRAWQYPSVPGHRPARHHSYFSAS